MKAKGTIIAAATTVALGLWKRHRRVNCVRAAEQDQKLMEDALQTFEGEGGLVLS